ncbi:unnamed protein product [Somion occarium]|uniref:non-specific serine/threonine protein kinase n=1 Tax=Somion occarium TaxID=3059160 RepID=A0ABP1E1K2_9APHY
MFFAKLKKLLHAGQDKEQSKNVVSAPSVTLSAVKPRWKYASLIALATAAQGDDAEVLFPRLFIQAVRPRRILVERPISHGVLANWFLMMLAKGCLCIPEVNHMLGIQFTTAAPLGTQLAGHEHADSSHDSSLSQSTDSSDSTSTIAVSPTLSASAFCDSSFAGFSNPPRSRTPTDIRTSSPANTTLDRLFLQDFTIQSQLGAGNFGTVHLARHKPSGILTALKVVSKSPKPTTKTMENTFSSSKFANKTRDNSGSCENPTMAHILEQSETQRSEAQNFLGEEFDDEGEDSCRDEDGSATRRASALEEFFASRRMESVQGVVQLLGSFHDENNFYFVMPYYPGGDLQSLLERDHRLPHEQAQLYTAQLLLGIEALHDRGIVHRDLKPGNILIDDNGHLIIADFGLAKCFETHMTPFEKSVYSVTDDTESYFAIDQTMRACGTPDYAAPEIYLQEWYSYPVDVWAIGVVTFRMFVGRSPWGSCLSMESLATAIVRQRMEVENWERGVFEMHQETELFFNAALDKDQITRPTASDLKAHSLFDGFDWDKLSRREILAPWVPMPYMKKPNIEMEPIDAGDAYDSDDDPTPFISYTSPILVSASQRDSNYLTEPPIIEEIVCIHPAPPTLHQCHTMLEQLLSDFPATDNTLVSSSDHLSLKSPDAARSAMSNAVVSVCSFAPPHDDPTPLTKFKRWANQLWQWKTPQMTIV